MEGVTALVFDSTEKKILCTKRGDLPIWVFPGGGIDPGETPEEATIREVEEETGLKVVIKRRVGHYLPYGFLFPSAVHVLECRVVGGKLQASSETPELDFFPLDKLPRPFLPTHCFWLQDALARHPFVLQQKEKRANLWEGALLLIKYPGISLRYLWRRF